MGRKWYLHHKTVAWKTLAPTQDRKQKTRIRPLKAGLEFVFDVEFQNLSQNELALLVYSLRPTPEFRHRLGLGKPLGLGTVQIQPVGVFLVDRRSRYKTDDLFGGVRYHHAAICDGQTAQSVTLPDAADDVQHRYDREVSAWNANLTDRPTWKELHDSAVKLLKEKGSSNAKAVVESLGNPATTGDTPVHYPRLPDELLPTVQMPDGLVQPNAETRLFQWHVWNEHRNAPQSLKPLSAASPLPAKLVKIAPFYFFLYDGLEEGTRPQRGDVEEWLRRHYPTAFHLPTGPLAHTPAEYQMQIARIRAANLIPVHLGIADDVDTRGACEDNHGAIKAIYVMRDLKKYLPSSE